MRVIVGKGANPWRQTFPQDLRNIDFRDASLARVDFGEADVTGAVFRDADLCEADLENVKGLIPEQLAGADLTRCKLPADVKGFPQLENVKEISKNAGALFLTMVLTCLFVILTCVTTRNIQLLANSGTAKLPVLNVEVPTGIFFRYAPWVVIVVYLSLHLYLQRLWTLMATLPAIFPDGVHADKKTYPWLLNDLIGMEFNLLRTRRQGAAVQLLAFASVAYLFAPATVFFVFLRCLPTHDASLLFTLGVQTVVAGIVAAAAKRMLIDAFRAPSETPSRTPQGWLVARWAVFHAALGALLFGIAQAALVGAPNDPSVNQREMLASLGLYASPSDERDLKIERNIENVIAETKRRVADAAPSSDKQAQADREISEALTLMREERARVRGSRGFVGAITRFLRSDVVGDLTEDVSRRSEKWLSPDDLILLPSEQETRLVKQGGGEELKTRREETMQRARQTLLSSVPTVRFVLPGQRTNLRYLQARDAFLVNGDFRGADLTGSDFAGATLTGSLFCDHSGKSPRGATLAFATLTGTDLTGTDLSQAVLTGADLSEADLTGTNLSHAVLTVADLSLADLTGADLSEADLTGADLSQADLTGAKLSHTVLTGADLSEANLTRADLSRKALRGAILSQAVLTGADLSHTTLARADLSKADLAGANLSHTVLAGADLSEADLTGTNLSHTILTGADLSQVDLTGADLSRKSLRGTILSGTDLTRANLSEANLTGADLSGADLSECLSPDAANWNGAIFEEDESPTWPKTWRMTQGRVETRQKGVWTPIYRIAPFKSSQHPKGCWELNRIKS